MSASVDRKAATLTKTRMKSTFNALSAHGKSRGWGREVSPETLTEKQWKGFVQARIEAGISARSIQNEMSHIRRALEGCGRGDFAKATTNAALGVPTGTRKGEGLPVDPAVLAAARERADPETRAWIDLQRGIGLRLNEMASAGPSLAGWQRQLEQGRGVLEIRDGSKGGRGRETFIPVQHRERALEAIKAARAAMAGREHLVPSVNGEAARQMVNDRYARLGLAGENSSHSLRRAFAKDLYDHYREQGNDDKRALGLVSRDLGHGEGRGRWVSNNYWKGGNG